MFFNRSTHTGLSTIWSLCRQIFVSTKGVFIEFLVNYMPYVNIAPTHPPDVGIALVLRLFAAETGLQLW